MTETWKPIPGYENYYEASTCGRIRSLDREVKHGKYTYVRKGVIRQPYDNKGYLNITLNKDGVETPWIVHRLIAMTFIPNPDNLPQVNHIDGNKLNNCVENLEWCTPTENLLHAYRTGLIDIEVTRASALKGADVSSIRVLCEDTGEIFNSISAARASIGCSDAITNNIHQHKRSHNNRGWLFKIIDEDYYQLHKDDVIDELKCKQIHESIRKRIKSQGKSIPIYCVERDIHYKSRSEAARDNKMNVETINLAIKENRKAKGLTFIIDE